MLDDANLPVNSGSSLDDSSGSPELQIVKWLRENAMTLSWVESGQGFNDLEPLGMILDGVRVVGLGEATHGTREVFQFKHRMLEYLVINKGFTVFVIEAGYEVFIVINEYVLYGQGNAAAALAGQGFWTWDTEEVLAMIEWVRRYNVTQREGRKVKFYGCDCQSVVNATQIVRRYVERVAPQSLGLVESAFEPLSTIRTEPAPGQEEAAAAHKEAVIDSLYTLLGFLSHHRMSFTRLTSPEEYEAALQNVRICIQYCGAIGRPAKPLDRFTLRDRAMAENIEYIINVLEPGSKAVVWAHNGHVTRSRGTEGPTTMGEYLSCIFGQAYYNFAFALNKGTFQSRDMLDPTLVLAAFSLPPAREETVEWYFAQVGLDNYIVNLRQPKPDAVERWSAERRPFREIGAGFSLDWGHEKYETTKPISMFDAVIYMESTLRARPNPTGWR